MRILAVGDDALTAKMRTFQDDLAQAARDKDAALAARLAEG